MAQSMTQNKKNRLLAEIYSSSLSISMTALVVVALLEIFMLSYTVVNPALYGPFIGRYRGFYISLLTVAVVAIILNLYAAKDIEKRFAVLRVSNPVCAVFFFAWSILVTYSDVSVTGAMDPSVFMTFSLTVPLSFYLFPGIYAIIALAADAMMLYISGVMVGSVGQTINLALFIVFQFVLGLSFLRLKMTLAERIIRETENADVDVMTGLANRRVYEEDMNRLLEEKPKADQVYIAIDINGLKDMNDTRGHGAGDKLIISAAQCMEQTFGALGKLYRIGGDEFVAMISAAPEDLEGLFRDYEARMQTWSEGSGISLSTSYGAVCAAEDPGRTIIEMARLADVRMYDAKAKYYQTRGRDRRRGVPQAGEAAADGEEKPS